VSVRFAHIFKVLLDGIRILNCIHVKEPLDIKEYYGAQMLKIFLDAVLYLSSKREVLRKVAKTENFVSSSMSQTN
jgi:hypothetical protein